MCKRREIFLKENNQKENQIKKQETNQEGENFYILRVYPAHAEKKDS